MTKRDAVALRDKFHDQFRNRVLNDVTAFDVAEFMAQNCKSNQERDFILVYCAFMASRNVADNRL